MTAEKCIACIITILLVVIISPFIILGIIFELIHKGIGTGREVVRQLDGYLTYEISY